MGTTYFYAVGGEIFLFLGTFSAAGGEIIPFFFFLT